MTSDADITPPGPTAAAQPVKADTEYIVLLHVEPTDGANSTAYKPVGYYPGRNPGAAIKAAVAANDNEGGTYVATPARSWTVIKVTPQVVTNLLLEETN